MSTKLILISILTTIFIGCNSSSRGSNFLEGNYLKLIVFDENIGCKKEIVRMMLSEESVTQFIEQTTKDEKELVSFHLIFYIEKGEVINLYENAILRTVKESKLKYRLNNENLKSKSYNGFHGLDSLIKNISQNNRPTSNDLLIISIDKENISCDFFDNIEKISALESGRII